MQVDYSNDFYPKIPFYMTYPMQSMYLTEMEYEKDMERMKQYYPAETKEIMELVEQRLDQLEYEGSRIYDEEPDRLMIQMEIDGIYRKLSEVQKKKENRIEGNMHDHRLLLRCQSIINLLVDAEEQAVIICVP